MSQPPFSRREMLGAAAATIVAGSLGATAFAQSATPSTPAATRTSVPDRGPRLDAAMVEEFVRAAHGNLARTREMLDAVPALINATWDWGGGDWETGLGGASHMGNVEIARLLLARGARMDVFCATMLGDRPLVEAFLAFDPGIVRLAGPHGISLLRHAQAGKQEAIVELLRARGAV